MRKSTKAGMCMVLAISIFLISLPDSLAVEKRVGGVQITSPAAEQNVIADGANVVINAQWLCHDTTDTYFQNVFYQYSLNGGTTWNKIYTKEGWFIPNGGCVYGDYVSFNPVLWNPPDVNDDSVTLRVVIKVYQYYGLTSDLKYTFIGSKEINLMLDNDDDGYYPPSDCNNNNAAVNPGATEICDGIDNNCDDQIDEGCECLMVPSPQTQTCYSGLSGTETEGVCHTGIQTCTAGAWGACVGEVIPAEEICDNIDNDCDGSPDDDLFSTCYTGPEGTLDIGMCSSGMKTCSAGSWSQCIGDVVPVAESCGDTFDNDCDGAIDCDDSDCSEDPYCMPKTYYLQVPKISNVYKASFDVTGTASNPMIYIGELDSSIYSIWENTGEFNYQAPVAVDDFSDALDRYVSDECIAAENEMCNVPISFGADSGLFSINKINVQYTNYWWDTSSIWPEATTYRVMLVAKELAVCGNAKVEGAEQCDDGNNLNGDGCSATCTRETEHNLECIYSASSCSSPYTEILKTSGTSDAHASLPGTGTFTYHICCKADGAAIGTANSGAKFLQLSSPSDDSHVQENSPFGFTNNAYISSDVGTLTCGYTTDCEAAGYDTCLGSISSAIDSHIGNCGAYSIDICCGFSTITPTLPPVICGNNVIEGTEQCDGANLGGQTCISKGFATGTLSCAADCSAFVISSCSICGDGIVSVTEECDNGASNSDTVPDACRTNCVNHYCGDSVKDSNEDCDYGTEYSYVYSGRERWCDVPSGCEELSDYI
jgi:cysteine-rich repeat protein